VASLELQFAPDKTQLVVSHKSLGPPLLRALGKHAGTLALTANRLGADCALQPTPTRRHLHQQAKRLRAHTSRFQRLRRLFRGKSAACLCTVGVKPVTTHGWEHGVPRDSDLLRLANQAATATGWTIPGLPLSVTRALLPVTCTPLRDAAWLPLGRLSQEFWLLNSPVRPPDALSYHELVKLW
jgi:hypothetical protein